MRATYRALREYGYADLTIKADRGGVRQVDRRDTLPLRHEGGAAGGVFDYILNRFVASIREVETTDPEARLTVLLDKLLVAPQENPDLSVALLEMRSQAPYNEAFAERFRQNDEYVRYLVKAVINHGIDEGAFADVDADRVTRSLLTIVDGARTRSVVFDDVGEYERARATAAEYVDATLREGDA